MKQFISKYKIIIILLITLGCLILMTLIPLLIWPRSLQIFADVEKIRALLQTYSAWAAIVYVIISIFAIMIPWLPNEIVPIVGGSIFGFWYGLLLSLVARIIGSTVNYSLGLLIAKGLSDKWLNPKEQQKIALYKSKISWPLVFISRFLPSADTDLVAYLAGIVKMKYAPFILASFLGMIIPNASAVFIGRSVGLNKYLFFALAGFYIIAIIAGPKIWRRLFKSSNHICN